MRRLATGLFLMAGLVLQPSASLAGGDAWRLGGDTVFQLGETVTGVLWVDPYAAGAVGVPADDVKTDDSFYVYLTPADADGGDGPWGDQIPETGVQVGEADIIMGGAGLPVVTAYQVVVSFVVPDVGFGDYWVWVCNEGCDQNLTSTVTCCWITINENGEETVPAANEDEPAAVTAVAEPSYSSTTAPPFAGDVESVTANTGQVLEEPVSPEFIIDLRESVKVDPGNSRLVVASLAVLALGGVSWLGSVRVRRIRSRGPRLSGPPAADAPHPIDAWRPPA